MNYEADKIAWAAGFFEGEGSIYAWPGKRKLDGTYNNYCKLWVTNTDESTIDLFSSCLNDIGRKFGPYHQGAAHHKEYWTYNITSFERVQFVISAFWPWLSPRRKEKAEEVLLLGRKSKYAEDNRHRAKIRMNEHPTIVSLYKSGVPAKEIGDRFNVDKTTIYRIVRGR